MESCAKGSPERRFVHCALFSGAGFTLIELMIVVAVLGLLAAIAVPNYNRYKAKSHQAEAKLALAGIYNLEKTFYAEYGAYVAGFDAIGYTPEGQKRFYSQGWSAASNAGTITGFPHGGGAFYLSRINFPASWTTCAVSSASFALSLPAATDVDSQSFIVGATGQIRDATACDCWYITNSKKPR